MSTDLPGFPSELGSVDVASPSVTLRVDAAVYPLDALYGAAYVFIDRCYVLLDKPDASWRVTLSWKKGEPSPEQLRALAGEFANELLSCAWRANIAAESRSIIESVTAQALAGAMGPPSLDELEKFDFSDDAFDDPLGIATSWEEKHKKKARADDPHAAPAADASGAAPEKKP
jgi:His-Xaa-Ser system protein HxsD